MNPKAFFFFPRYEEEINRRNDCENTFVLAKKVCVCFSNIPPHSYNYN